MLNKTLTSRFFTIIVKVEPPKSISPQYYYITGIDTKDIVLKRVFELNQEEYKSVERIFSTNYQGMVRFYDLEIVGGRIVLEMLPQQEEKTNTGTGGRF